MGYALKIKGVDFSNVAVDRIEYIVPIPCTGIALDKSTLVFAKVGDTNQITATLTPTDTTDTLSWASSNENVATVSSSGLVTIHGIGTATITATCGNQTATASISQTTIKAEGTLKRLTGKYVSSGSGVNYAFVVNDTSGQNAFLNENENHPDLQVVGGVSNNCELIRVPYGATTVKVATVGGNDVQFNYMYRADTTQKVTYNNVQYSTRASNYEQTFVTSSVGATVAYGQAIVFRATDAKLEADAPSYVYFE